MRDSRAKAASSSKTNWHAYLSTTGAGGVDARDRIGRGPWVNAKGVTIARNVDDLHTAKLSKEMLLNEKGGLVNGAGDTPNTHDMLTGSDTGGRYLSIGSTDSTCKNWTSNGEGSAMLGHHDGKGPPNATARHFTSWNAAPTSASRTESLPARVCSTASRRIETPKRKPRRKPGRKRNN